MTTGEIYEAEIHPEGRRGHQAGRVLATVIGAGALIVGAFLNWIPGHTGDKITDKALVQTTFAVQNDLVKALGGLCILIALIALIGLVDRTGWLTRLAGAASLVMFVLFGVQAFRFYGDNLGTAASHLQAGAWLTLAAAVVLLAGGFLGARVARVPTVVDAERAHASGNRPV